MKVAFVMDRLESLDASLDSTLGMMHAAQERGYEVWTTEAGQLEACGGRARNTARQVHLAATRPVDGCRWLVADPWFTASEPQHVWLDDMHAVFVRPEPPFDEAYRTATLILDLVDQGRTPVVNSPSGLRECSEHLFPLRFPDLIPPTLVTADPRVIRAFVDEHRRAVVKPVDGFGGHGVFLLDGEPVAAVNRYLPDGDFRIKHPAEAAPLTGRDREICARIAPSLRHLGIRIAGLDVIGPHLIEVNVTCPGALRKADGLLGWTLCADAVDAVLTLSTERRFA